jgi:uncharacterized Zn finger protein (UPF0148 family)
MASYSEHNAVTGEYEEGDIGEAQCPKCGYPVLAKFQNGELVETFPCPYCDEGKSPNE